MKTGRQEPTFERVGKYAYSMSEEVADMFMEDGGATFYPAQLHELEVMLARNKDGSPAAVSVGISRPRQNGKSYGARYYAAYMADFEHRNVLYSAHHSTTTNKMFQALCDLFESPERFPEFANDVKQISRARGYEGIYFRDWKDDDGQVHKGGCIEFATRTKSGSRGGTYSVIIVDEAQEMTDEQQEAMLPVVSAASDAKDASAMPQQIYVGTPPGPTCNGTVFRKMHDAAHSNNKLGTSWWLEWAYETSNMRDQTMDRDKALELAYMTNPALGYRIAEKTVLNEFEQMSLDGFCRERLGWWTPVMSKQDDFAMNRELWMACRSTDPKPEGKTAYGVKFSIDGTTVYLAGAVMPKDGSPARISLIKVESTGRGIRWLSDWLNERYKQASCVVIDGRNGVDVLVEQIAPVWKFKGSVMRPTAIQMVAAVSMLTNMVAEGTLTWFHQQEILNQSAITSVKRPIAGGWGFGGEQSGPIEAAALALWGVHKSKRDPSRKGRIG